MAGPLPRTCPHDSMKKQEVYQEYVLRCVSFNKQKTVRKYSPKANLTRIKKTTCGMSWSLMDWRVAKKWEELSLFLFMSWREEVKRKIITWLSYHLGDPIRESRHCLVWLKLARNMVDHQFNSLLLLFQTRKLIYSLSTWWCRAERCYLYWYHVDRQHWLLEREISSKNATLWSFFF